MQKLIYKIIIVAAAILTLGSCSMYREYERPKLHYLDSLYRRLPDLQDSSSIAELSWREFFADTTLQEWIRLGISFNTDLSIARFKVDQAQATLHAARRAFFPSASLSAETGTNGSSMSYSLTPSFSWEADIFGKMTNAKRSAVAAVEQSIA